MVITKDEWTLLFADLRAKIADPSRLLAGVGTAARDCTLENFGATGTNRPNEWPALSERYAKKVKRTYATLEVTGELKGSIGFPNIEGNSVSITAGDEKASYHQIGEGNNKLRQFFPVDDQTGEATDYFQAKVNGFLDGFFTINP
jgi:hypothetical protein